MKAYKPMDNKTTNFIAKARVVHGERYSYENAHFVNHKTKIEVTCPKHGGFFVTPGNHTTNKSGCPKCKTLRIQTTVREKESAMFIKACSEVHHHKYSYANTTYVNAHTPVTITCPLHGDFSMVAYTHRQGGNCPKCARAIITKHNTMSQEEFVRRASETHKKKYIYDYVNYHNAKTKVQIICPEHGPFFQRPGSHLRGDGCPECGKDSWFAEQGGYSQRLFDTNPSQKTEPGILYCVRFTSPSEEFYKVGITKRSIRDRFHWGYSEYDMEVIYEHHTTLYEAWTTEQRILNVLKSSRYCPSIKIGGFTECLSKHISIEGVIKLMQQQ